MSMSLWRDRVRPRLASRRWFVVWAKRALHLPGLARLWQRAAVLRMRGAHLGRLVVIEPCQIRGTVSRLSVGESSFIGAGATIMLHDDVRIGKCVVINQDVTILTASHDLRDPRWRMYCRSVLIEDYAWIATGAMLLPGVRIGRGAVVGAGAVVRGDVPDHAVVAGNPAAPLDVSRNEWLDYNPAAFAAPLEAWLGTPGDTRV